MIRRILSAIADNWELILFVTGLVVSTGGLVVCLLIGFGVIPDFTTHNPCRDVVC